MVRSRALAAYFCVLLLGAGGAALADTVHLSSGGVVRGRIVKETSRGVTVQTAGGLTVVSREDIERIERGASTVERYRAKLRKIDRRDPDARRELARWCERRPDGDELARREYRAILELVPDDAEARKKLGYVRREGRWVLPGSKPASAPRPAKRSRKTRRAARLAVPASPELNEALAAVRSAKAEKRAAAWELLADEAGEVERLRALLAGESSSLQKRLRSRLGLGEGDLASQEVVVDEALQRYAQEVLRPAVNEALEAYGRAVLRRRARAVGRLADAFGEHVPGVSQGASLTKRSEALDRWAKARDEALRVVFDKSIYPDANHGRSGQPVVDEKVDACRAAFAPFDALVRKDLARLLRLDAEGAEALLSAVALETTRLAELGHVLEARGLAAAAPPSLPAALEALVTYRAGKVERALVLAERLDPWSQALLQRLRDERVRDYNASFRQKNPLPFGVQPSGTEIEQVRITNDYRILMGRPALAIDPRLVQSARGHSADMTRLGFFDHTSPVQGKRTPAERMAAAGYPSPGGENISLGSVTPKATHLAWYNSSGHHRNILGATWTAMGAGQDGQHWTQNFGSHSELLR
ncbi:MAG: CAP domain-containing protein [Planctomycetota bacterium]|nr:MAG: CAP domain-containing protein [Planctomycetota bacterium]